MGSFNDLAAAGYAGSRAELIDDIGDLEKQLPGWQVWFGVSLDEPGTWHARPRLKLIDGPVSFRPACTGPGTQHVSPLTKIHEESPEALVKSVKLCMGRGS